MGLVTAWRVRFRGRGPGRCLLFQLSCCAYTCIGLYRTEPNRTGPDQTGSHRTGLDRTEPDRTGPNRTEPDRTGPNRTALGLKWTELGMVQKWTELDQTGSTSVHFRSTSFAPHGEG